MESSVKGENNMLKPYEEIYFIEVGLNQFKNVSIDVKKETYKITVLKEEELDEDAVVMNPNTLEALLAGLVDKGFKEIK